MDLLGLGRKSILLACALAPALSIACLAVPSAALEPRLSVNGFPPHLRRSGGAQWNLEGDQPQTTPLWTFRPSAFGSRCASLGGCCCPLHDPTLLLSETPSYAFSQFLDRGGCQWECGLQHRAEK